MKFHNQFELFDDLLVKAGVVLELEDELQIVEDKRFLSILGF
jgi:hypothetical protein